MIDNADKQRKSCFAHDLKDERSVEGEFHMINGCAHSLKAQDCDRSRLTAFLVNQYSRILFRLTEVNFVCAVGQGSEVRFFSVKNICDAKRVQSVAQINCR